MSEGVDGQHYGLLGGGLFSSISCVINGVSAEGFDLFAQLAKALFAAGGNDEVGSVTGESDGCGAAYAGAGSSDEGSFTS